MSAIAAGKRGQIYFFGGITQAATIAARERLDLGVGTLIKQEQALIFSAGGDDNALNIGGALDENGTGLAMLTYGDVRDDLEENSLRLVELEEATPSNSSSRLCFQPPTKRGQIYFPIKAASWPAVR